MRGLASLQKSATFSSIQNSFYWAGIKLNYDNGVPDIVVDVETWLVQKNSPESILKEEYFAMQQKRKRKRVNTKHHGHTMKERKEQAKQKEKEPKGKEKEDIENSEVVKEKQPSVSCIGEKITIRYQ